MDFKKFEGKIKKEVLDKVKEWLKYDKFPHSRKEITSILEKGDEKELESRLMKRIFFGTAGLRAAMRAGFSTMNDLIIVQTTQGLTKYLFEQFGEEGKKKGVIIGYDHRNYGDYSSKRFAELTASIFLHQGYKVYLFPEIVPTPFVPYGIGLLKCACGIMVTASHNPKADNGYKLYWDNGCQITPPHDASIQKKILENLEIWDGVDLTCANVSKSVEDPSEFVIEKYFKEFKRLSFRSKEENAKSKTVMTYTAMHGVGSQWIRRAFKEFGLPPVVETKEQAEPDATFKTVAFPNPEEGKGSLGLALQQADRSQSRVVIANDPDADRLAVAEKQKDGEWRLFNGNEIALFLGDWLWTNYKKKNTDSSTYKDCYMVASTVSSKILKGMGLVEGFSFDETLTGFKWIGNRGYSLKQEGKTFLLGFEVEIGFVVSDMSFDKDGIRVSPFFYEYVDTLYNRGETLSGHLYDLYKKYGFYEMRTKYFFCDSNELLFRVFNGIRTLNNGKYPEKVGEFKIKYVRDLTVGYDNSQPGNKPALPVDPNAQMITFTLDDDSVCTLRNSGTEPKLKWYAECFDKDPKIAKEKVLKLSRAIIDEFIQPEKYSLEGPKDWKLE